MAMVIKIKKTKKSVKQRGKTTHGHGARKKWKGKGHRGGKGMAGTGKRADHKKSLIIKKYGNKYFGKQGITSKGTARKKVKKINLRDIEMNYDSLKKFEKNGLLDLSEYKILGEGKLSKKVNIKALDISKKARENIEKVGGSVEILRKKEENKKEEVEVQEKGESEEI